MSGVSAFVVKNTLPENVKPVSAVEEVFNHTLSQRVSVLTVRPPPSSLMRPRKLSAHFRVRKLLYKHTTGLQL